MPKGKVVEYHAVARGPYNKCKIPCDPDGTPCNQRPGHKGLCSPHTAGHCTNTECNLPYKHEGLCTHMAVKGKRKSLFRDEEAEPLRPSTTGGIGTLPRDATELRCDMCEEELSAAEVLAAQFGSQ